MSFFPCFTSFLDDKEAATLEQRLVQGAWVRTPPTTVPGQDMACDVKSTLNLFQLGIRPQVK